MMKTIEEEPVLPTVAAWNAIVEERDHLRAQVARVREVHQEVQLHFWPAPMVCQECERPWPCPTVAALGAAPERAS